MKDFFQSKSFKGLVLALAALLLLLLTFKAGIFIGARRADFSCRWSDNYHKNFAGPRGGFGPGSGFGDRDFLKANGVFGQIIKISDDSLVIKGPGEMEKVVAVDSETIIEKFREKIKINDLQVNDYAVVIGEPQDNGQIKAKLMRIMPALPEEPQPRREEFWRPF